MRDASRRRITWLFAGLATKQTIARAVDGAKHDRGARSCGPPALRRCLGAAAAAGPRYSTAPKGLHEKCPAVALRPSSNRTSVRPSSRALRLSTFRANAAPSGFCISLLAPAASSLRRPPGRPHSRGSTWGSAPATHYRHHKIAVVAEGRGCAPSGSRRAKRRAGGL